MPLIKQGYSEENIQILLNEWFNTDMKFLYGPTIFFLMTTASASHSLHNPVLRELLVQAP
jgi:hypothetical protein